MTINARVCTSFRQEMLRGEHDLENDVLKMALYNEDASLGAATTIYTTTHEIVQTGYEAGGKPLSNVTVSANGDVATVDFDDLTWAGVTFDDDPPRGALIYRVSDGKTIAVINFGGNQYVTSGNFKFEAYSVASSHAFIEFA